MFTLWQAFSVLVVAGLTSASKWDEGLDGDLLGELPAPTPDPYLAVNELYPDLPWGAAPLSYAPGSSKRKRLGMEGRLGIRAPTCDDAGYILSCPISEHLPCCPAAHPICCHDPSDTCLYIEPTSGGLLILL
ncbi:hypothetical protein CPB86DRAFT_30952 [Serendipita vermifera]|nr:hypothetical protein CPB86DRAFT_30952 [Serendipita vermifera]